MTGTNELVGRLLTKAVMLDTSNHGSVSATRDMLREAATLIERLAASQAKMKRALELIASLDDNSFHYGPEFARNTLEAVKYLK